MPSTATDPTHDLSRLWSAYAVKVYTDYPLYVALAGAVAADRHLLSRILDCPGEGHDPNMLLAALQYLVLGDLDRHSAIDRNFVEMYADPLQSPADAGERLHPFYESHWDQIVRLLSSRHVQTNETGRCGGIALGLAATARELGEPLALIDDGASAGLNLGLDEYAIDFGPAGRIGPGDSPVRVECRLTGHVDPTLMRMPAIEQKVGIDRAPVDVTDPDAVRWMLACVWPGRGRQERARAALELAALHPGRVRHGDMVTDLAAAIDEVAPCRTVVVTSWSYSYLNMDARPAFQEVLRNNSQRPIAWLCMDLLGVEPLFSDVVHERGPTDETPSVLGLAVFDDGVIRSARPLALMHPHGHWVDWLPA